MSACTKMRDAGILNMGNFSDSTDALKDDADIPIAVAIDYSPMMNDARYSAVVKRDYDRVTFGYQMKHGAIVKDNGTMDFTNADALVNAVGNMVIHGHTLGWHANQNATYLKSYAGITVPSATELVTNAGFESGLTGWSTFNNANGATVAATNTASDVHGGTGAMKVVNPVANPGSQWKVQVASALFNTTVGKQYAISYWVKAAAAGGSIRLSTQDQTFGSAQYQGDQTIGTTYTQISWTITANSAQTRILFDMGQAANTYYIDDASVKEVIAVPTGAQVAAKVDTALNTFITAMVNHYKSKVHSWDVVNELFADDGNIRNNKNTLPANPPSDFFVWSEYLGRDYALKAFNYAKAADPTALFFINDYALESNSTKLDSLIAMVKELKSKGAKVDGIGTQMHIAWNTSYTGIDQMMQKLAATGLLIHLSELDVKINPSARSGFVLTPLEANYQAEMYKYAIQSYLKYIPKAQQFGITIWGVTDNTSWLYNNGQDFPLLYNADYSKKQSYSAVSDALKGK
jgi:endo-1,4-beta-xylanase